MVEAEEYALERVFHVRLSEDAYEALGKAARDDDRSASSYARTVLLGHLRREGYLKDKPRKRR